MRSQSLSDYGVWLERNFHNTSHMRWADDSRSVDDGSIDFFGVPPTAWDLSSNDYLGSTYSSHVTPIFWRLHGYVDNRINDWLPANNFDSTDISCNGRPRCYQWKRLWDGPVPMSRSTTMAASHANMFDPGRLEGLGKDLLRTISDNSTMVPAQ